MDAKTVMTGATGPIGGRLRRHFAECRVPTQGMHRPLDGGASVAQPSRGLLPGGLRDGDSLKPAGTR